ncbi:MAG TPA: helix-turn-helix transcriptional regulator [Candidatus Cybelea sp.]|nr:helix-turn-helix transcriptional regulator [Candidatus Cybelea sp.]
MEVAGPEQGEQLISRCHFSEAAARLAGDVDRGDDAQRRARLRAAAFALSGDDSNLALAAAPDLIAARTAPAAASFLAAVAPAPDSNDYLCAAVVLSWSGEPSAVLDLFREAHDRAIDERRLHFAVGARERMAHHALLFGETQTAKSALEDAMRLAAAHGLETWQLRAAAACARLALDIGEPERAAELVARFRRQARSSDEIALLAGAAAGAAVACGDERSLREWTSEEIVQVALRSTSRESAIAATLALLAPAENELASNAAVALRRAVLANRGSTGSVELLSLAARFGDLDEARLAADALGALGPPNRKYLKAHALLARAHVLLRCSERAAGIDHAGDAARAFNAIGMRRWMNEAMSLLVRQEDEGYPRRRRGHPLGSALTSREQQVAHLIRRGARNREVATALQISEHTVERHVSSILGRLGLRSRWQIVDPKNASEH